jgi:hypothetical protein
MCIQDVFGTAMVIFEARLNAPVAGLFDMAGWIAGLICSALAISEIVAHGWRTRKSLVIIGTVSVANFVGTYGGVLIGSTLTHKGMT